MAYFVEILARKMRGRKEGKQHESRIFVNDKTPARGPLSLRLVVWLFAEDFASWWLGSFTPHLRHGPSPGFVS